MGLVIGEDKVPFVESSRVNIFVVVGFGACFVLINLLLSARFS